MNTKHDAPEIPRPSVSPVSPVSPVLTLRLLWLDLLVRRAVFVMRHRRGERPDEGFRGLVIRDGDVDAILEGHSPPETLLFGTPAASPELLELDKSLAQVSRELHRAELLAQKEGHPNPLDILTHRFGLDALERELLCLGLAVELDPKYERLFAYLHDDVQKPFLTVGLTLQLLAPSLNARLEVRRRFEGDSALHRWELIRLGEGRGEGVSALLSRPWRLDERIAGFLLGSSAPDRKLQSLIEPLEVDLFQAGSRVELRPEQLLPDALVRELDGLLQGCVKSRTSLPLFAVTGRSGSGRTHVVRLLAQRLGCPVLSLSARWLETLEGGMASSLRLVAREAMLRQALVCWLDADECLEAAQRGEPRGRAFVEGLEAFRSPCVLVTALTTLPSRAGGRAWMRLELPDSTAVERRERWTGWLDRTGQRLEAPVIEHFSERFRLSAGQIDEAYRQACSLAWRRDGGDARILREDLELACQRQSRSKLDQVARRVDARYGWEDLVLPDRHLETLRLMQHHLEQRARVFGEWGFAKKHSLERGALALFSGPPGTGKTLAAGVLAREVGLELYVVELSSVVSKYIGETEKNLEQIFSEAERSDVVLFFDEADALFGKRSEVKDAHDRHANVEVAYLLQRVERFDGLLILATNFRSNLDEAFLRRMRFVMEFPQPEEPERLKIWQRVFPSEAPLSADVDLTVLARQLKIAGGHIRNIALSSALLAARDGDSIHMKHLTRASEQEMLKMGRVMRVGG